MSVPLSVSHPLLRLPDCDGDFQRPVVCLTHKDSSFLRTDLTLFCPLQQVVSHTFAGSRLLITHISKISREMGIRND